MNRSRAGLTHKITPSSRTKQSATSPRAAKWRACKALVSIVTGKPKPAGNDLTKSRSWPSSRSVQTAQQKIPVHRLGTAKQSNFLTIRFTLTDLLQAYET